MSQAPTVYFIDDSATMREVIKIAFRRENMNVVACHSGSTALGQMEQVRPDVVISDVIMPEKDGYEVCHHIKSHPRFSRTPVILMSGVVNRAVAEKAFAVKADELIRKPFQPQDLIARVRHLLNPKAAPQPVQAAAVSAATAVLSSIFATPANGIPLQPRATAMSSRPPAAVTPISAPPVIQPVAVAQPISVPNAPRPVIPKEVEKVSPAITAVAPLNVSSVQQRPLPPNGTNGAGNHDIQKLKIEVLRLSGLVKKLQSELEAEREYSRALEEHVKTLQEAD